MVIKTRFNITDKAFCMHKNSVFNNPITGIKATVYGEEARVKYRIIGSDHTPVKDHVWIPEELCFADRELLLQSL
jgi:hypothetical protein